MTSDEAKEIIIKERDSLKANPMVKVEDCLYEAFDIAIEILEQQHCKDVGELSDGYHTFNQLYHQRAVLFACIVKQNKNKAWKSFKHSDGKYCFDSNGEWFIVGIDTPQGSYTYHYTKEYWDMFDCQELECGKEWDGHTEEDVTRLLSLEQQPCETPRTNLAEDAISRAALLEELGEEPFNWNDSPEAFQEVRDYQWFKSLVENAPLVTPKAEPCEDAISREAVIDLVADYDLHMGQVVRGIHALPSVTPSRPKGHWISHREHCENLGLMPSGLGAYEWCSNCDCGIDIKEFHRIHYNFCPNCGADMKESEK
jgi:hypothetical protein